MMSDSYTCENFEVGRWWIQSEKYICSYAASVQVFFAASDSLFVFCVFEGCLIVAAVAAVYKD